MNLSVSLSAASQADALFEEGEKHYATNIDEAIRLYTAALQKQPDLVKALNSRGELFLEKKDFQAALVDFNKAIELDPSDTDGWINKGCAFLQSQRYDKAGQFFEKAIELDPNDPLALHNLARVNELRNNMDKAIELCGKALSSLDLEQDTEFEIRVSRANLYERRWAYQKEQGTLAPRGIFTDIDLAILDWTKALEIDPDYIDGYNSRATAHYLNQNFEEARRDYSIAIARAPHNGLYLKNRAVTFEKLNKPLEAEEDRKRALALDSSLQLGKEIAKKARSLSIEFANNYDLKQECKSNVNSTPPPEEYEDSEIDRLPDMFSKLDSHGELSLKTHLKRLQTTLEKTQEFNQELDSKLEALQKHYEKKNVERGLMVELLSQKLNSLNNSFKLLLSAYIAITVLDFIMALRKSGIDVFKDILKKPKRFLHLILAISGMRLLLAKKPFSKIHLFQE